MKKRQLTCLKNKFTIVLCADYQMVKLIPQWGSSAQPGSTYYLQKLAHDVFGIMNHCSGDSTVFLFDECAGPKNTDHAIFYLTEYFLKLPEWCKCVHIFLDNTCSTNKNYYLMSWAYEMVQQNCLSFFRVSFLLDLFSKIAKSYNHSNVFNTEELKEVISPLAKLSEMMEHLRATGEMCLQKSTQRCQEFRSFMILFT